MNTRKICFYCLTAVLLTAAGAVGGGLPDAAEVGGNAWRSADAMHPIQSEMQPYVREMVAHAFDSYIKYAFPKDELRSVSGTGKNTMGGYGWTLIDSLDTLAVAGFHTEFRRYARWVEENVNFDIDVSVSLFETTIRALGGLLAAHFMYEEGVVEVVPTEHNYTGGLLRLAADLGNRMLPCFNTSTGIPYGSFNLRHGVSRTETPIASTAAAGTLLLEMTVLSALTGDDRYMRASRRASEALFAARDSHTDLMGNHINAMSGRWSFTESHVSGDIDSAIEYFIKAHIISGDMGDWERFERSVRAINRYIRKGGMLTFVSMRDGSRIRSTHESLASFFPGNLLLGGHNMEAVESCWPIHSIFKHFGGLPESFSLETERTHSWNNAYPQRPEHAESVYMLYRATRDPVYLVMGRELVLAINLRMRTPYGFSSLRDVNHPHHDGRHEDLMESFMLAETLKYLYLLFDECNVIHVQGRAPGSIPSYCSTMPRRGSETRHVGWLFNTEAHLFPNTAEWWGPLPAADALEREEVTADILHRKRLSVIDELLRGLDASDANHKEDAEADVFPHRFYCANHAISDIERISRFIFR
ncbi:putative mannosyl-oligosaccharide 1,2-alpha-mannosidase IB [Trypanosoma theileri]|uniref:alpha-1,2-Mannosidase n=1 Tax=Trypanosoma theileri TaxID=67003 RepID=A0A1X0NYE2_9TRYP|nr:putative mannosyl-oligosaccharide 1,2-alpha-mannosidase IB [Trypanosoma theileri]ORC89180.1 putative mannosyl-oligosaccharide 1,2-alpha-mannosidase IB [Trypanosoma theileri]